LIAALFVGCMVQSIHPLFMEKDYISLSALVGTWVQKEGDKPDGKDQACGFSRRTTSGTSSHTRTTKGRKATFHIAAGKIGTNVFLDSVLDDLVPGGDLNDLAGMHLIPAHTFLKVVKTEAGLTLVAMDLEWLDTLLKENPKAIAHIYSGQGKETVPVLTASTEDLQKFVAKYAADEKVFKDEVKLLPKLAQ